MTPSHSYVNWGGVFAGAVIAAAISFVLFSFGSAIGLTVAPLTPSWRTSSIILGVLSGLWILAITIGAMAAGGYVVGRMRTTWHVTHTDEVEFRDGLHGLVVWALAVTLGALLSATAAMAVLAGASLSSGDRAESSGTSPYVSGYQLDQLLRPAKDEVTEAPPLLRDEAGRIFAAAIGNAPLAGTDRTRLDQLVRISSGLTLDQADRRVDESITATRAKAISARHASIILAFILAASLVAGAATSWETARIGGRHRDSAAPPSLVWRTDASARGINRA